MKLKLGLIITNTSGGVQEKFAINKQSEWATYASDVRSVIKELKYFDTSGKTITIVTMLGKRGYLVGVVQAREGDSGRANDNTTAWIHVPAKMDISGKELEGVIKVVEEQLSNTEIREDKLYEEFSKEYDQKDVLFAASEFISNNPKAPVKWVLYGKGTDYLREELLGEGIAQNDYRNYKCIVFVPSSECFSAGDNITIKEETIKISAPLPDKGGFKPFVKIPSNENPELPDSVPFNKSLELPDGFPLEIVWEKEDYKDIKKENLEDLAIKDDERLFRFRRSWIKVESESIPHKNLGAVAIVKVNEKKLSEDIFYIQEAEVKYGIKIKVSCEGYEDEEYAYSLKEGKNILIKLKDKVYEQEFTLSEKDGRDLTSEAKVVVTTRNKPAKMPFKGYQLDKDVMKYEDNITLKAKWFSIGVASVLALILLWQSNAKFKEHYAIKFQWALCPIKVEKKQPQEATAVDEKTDEKTHNNLLEEPKKSNKDGESNQNSSSSSQDTAQDSGSSGNSQEEKDGESNKNNSSSSQGKKQSQPSSGNSQEKKDGESNQNSSSSSQGKKQSQPSSGNSQEKKDGGSNKNNSSSSQGKKQSQSSSGNSQEGNRIRGEVK